MPAINMALLLDLCTAGEATVIHKLLRGILARVVGSASTVPSGIVI